MVGRHKSKHESCLMHYVKTEAYVPTAIGSHAAWSAGSMSRSYVSSACWLIRDVDILTVVLILMLMLGAMDLIHACSFS